MREPLQKFLKVFDALKKESADTGCTSSFNLQCRKRNIWNFSVMLNVNSESSL